MDIILLLGSVTPKQYQPLRLAMIRKGLKPHVRRVTKVTHRAFFNKACAEWESVNGEAHEDNTSEWGSWVNKRSDEIAQAFFHESLREASVSEIKVIVYPHGVKTETWDWMVAEIPSLVPAYRVEQSESSDEQWLAGTGFGDILEIK